MGSRVTLLSIFYKKDLIIEVAKDVPRHAVPDHGTSDMCSRWSAGADAPRHQYMKD
jgi:hypothetical protein